MLFSNLKNTIEALDKSIDATECNKLVKEIEQNIQSLKDKTVNTDPNLDTSKLSADNLEEILLILKRSCHYS